MTATISPATYAELLAEHQPRPIRSQKEYRRLLKVAESITRPKLTRDEGIFLDLLGGLIEAYEARQFSIPDATPLQVLEHLIDAQGISHAAFARKLGVSRQMVTDILSGRRSITVENLRRFADFFNVSPTVFVPRTGRV
jgi:HTH-type transcriptional regulator/antitoxin HigA